MALVEQHQAEEVCEFGLNITAMSLVKESARLFLRPCLQAVDANCKRAVKIQGDFEGVFNPFLWNERNGFGVTKHGNVVLVSSEYNKSDLAVKSESDVWQDIIDPPLYIFHEPLRDELQMRVLAYDDDAVQHSSTDKTSMHKLPIYRGDISMMTSHDETSPSGQNTGSNGGPTTVSS